MSKTRQRFGGIIINWITIFAQVVISLFFIPFFLKTVGDMQYGLYSFSTSLIAWLDTLMVAIASAYYKFLTREKKKNGEYGEARACGVFWKIFLFVGVIVLALGLLFDAMLFFNIIPLNEYTQVEKNQICVIILISVISTFITCSLTVRKSYHYYKQKYILVYTFSLAQILLQTVFSIALLKNGHGVVGVAFVHFGLSVFFTVVLSAMAKIFLKEKISIVAKSEDDKRYRRKLFIEILVFSSFIIINTVVDTMNKTLDKTILGFYNSDSVATYQLAYTIPSYLISFTSIISIVFNQRMNDAYYNGKGIEEMNEIFLKVSKLQTIFTFLLVGGFVACGKEFIFMWLDSGRINVYYISSIFMIVYSITCSNRLAIIGRRIQNYHIKASFIYLGIAIFNIALSLLLVNLVHKEKAIWACVFGTVLTYIIGHWVIMQIYDKRITGLNIPSFFKNFLKYLSIAATIDIVVIRFGEMIQVDNLFALFAVKGIFFAFSYICIIFLIEKEMLNNLKQKFFKKRGEY